MTEKTENIFTEDQKARYESLRPSRQVEFNRKYNSRKKSIFVCYWWWFWFGFHYAYLGQWAKTLAYVFTGGGFLVWMLWDMFSIPSKVRKANVSVVDEILLECS